VYEQPGEPPSSNVIHSTRKLARQIHRRSIWQVVSVYALVAVTAVAGSRALTGLAGLPSWTPTLALALTLVLFPLVLATTLAQGGIPGLRLEDAADPNEVEGLTPEQVHVVPEAHPLHRAGVLTWRNTVLSGVAALALLLGSVAAYLTMWALGIGPVGSLLAQGIIEEGEPVVVTAFANRTDDPSLGASIADLLESDLSLSRLVRVVAADDPAADPTILISGTVAPSLGGITISARLVHARSGALLASFQESTSDDDDVLRAVEQVAERVRERLGEPMRLVRGGPRLGAIKSESTEALRLVRLAHRARTEGDRPAAVALLREALDVDGDFAWAWRSLGALYDQSSDAAGAIEAYRSAIDSWEGTGVARRTVPALEERIAALGG
jgi:TolB-like protein